MPHLANWMLYTIQWSTVKLRYNNPRYNNILRYNYIFSADQKLYLLINAIRYNNMIRYNNTWGADQAYCYSGALPYFSPNVD